EDRLRSSIQSSHSSATNSSAPLIRCRIETQPGSGKRISKISACRLRYFGRGFLTVLTAASDMLQELYSCGGAVESSVHSLFCGVLNVQSPHPSRRHRRRG